jgi:N-acetylglucosaminyl-diphospho-decaprenol L-rhamnosyltransferase
VDGCDIAVIIVSWNVRDLLVRCLDSVYTALDVAGLRGEVWVVDNASSDDSAEAVRERSMATHVIASPANLGFAGGNNLALSVLGFDKVAVPVIAEGLRAGPAHLARARKPSPRYVLLLNPDTVVRPNALDTMMQFMDRTGQAGVCGARLVYADGSFQHSAYRFPSLMQTFLDFWPVNWRLIDSRLNGRYPRRWYERGEPFAIDHPLGATMLLRREAIEQTGGFDLDYGMYVEEIDWCMRIRRFGWSIYCVPRAEVIHYEGQSTRQVRPAMVVALWKSRYTLFSKWYPPLYCRVARCLVRVGMRSRIRQAEAMRWRGALDGQDTQALVDAYRQVIAM